MGIVTVVPADSLSVGNWFEGRTRTIGAGVRIRAPPDVRPVSYTALTRMILTLEEAKALLDESKVGELWESEMTYTANLLAASSGMR